MADLKLGECLFRVHWTDPPDGRGSPQAGRWDFAYTPGDPHGTDAEAALRDAVDAYYKAVPEGQEERVRGFNPNWGDAVVDIPAEHWAEFGLRLLPDEEHPTVEISVGHDEHVYDYD